MSIGVSDQTQARVRQLIEQNVGNLVVELAHAHATIEALRAELAQVKAEKPKDP